MQKYLERVENSGLFGLLVLFALMGVVLLIRSNFIDLPFERDEGTYIHFATLILQGGLPYETFYDPKPPGLYYFYALIIYLFGKISGGLHLAFICIHLLSIYSIFRLGRLLFGQIPGLVTAISFALLSLNPHIGGFSLLSEHLLVFFLIVGLLYMVKARDNYKLWSLSGLLIGISFFIKQNGLFFIGFGCVYILLVQQFTERKHLFDFIKKIGVFMLSSLFPSIIIFIFFFFHGSHEAYIYWTFLYGLRADFTAPFTYGLKIFSAISMKMFIGNPIWYIIIAISTLLLVTRISKSKNDLFLVMLAVCSLLAITPRWIFHGHYFLLLVPILALLVGHFFFLLQHWLAKRFGRLVSLAWLCGLLLVLSTADLGLNSALYFNPDLSGISRMVYGLNPFIESREISRRIKERASDEDELVVLGSEMQIYHYTGLSASTKHLYGPYLVDGSIEHDYRQQAFVKDMETSEPRFMIYIDHPLSWVISPGSSTRLFEWFQTFTKEKYSLVGLADTEAPSGSVTYRWDDEVDGYKTKGRYQIYVWEHRRFMQ